jgi:hypothetical protein
LIVTSWRALGDGLAHEPEDTRKFQGLVETSLYAAPWLKDDPDARLLKMPVEEIAAVDDVIPPGVMARHRASPFYPAQVPDLIGVKDRRFLNRTGLQQQHSIVRLHALCSVEPGRR